MNKKLHNYVGEILYEHAKYMNRRESEQLSTLLIFLMRLSDSVEEWRGKHTKYAGQRVVEAHDAILKLILK